MVGHEKARWGYLWVEYLCSKCGNTHRARYALFDDLKGHGAKLWCGLYKDLVCVHETRKWRKEKAVYVKDDLNLPFICEVMTKYYELFMPVIKGSLKVKVETDNPLDHMEKIFRPLEVVINE